MKTCDPIVHVPLSAVDLSRLTLDESRDLSTQLSHLAPREPRRLHADPLSKASTLVLLEAFIREKQSRGAA